MQKTASTEQNDRVITRHRHVVKLRCLDVLRIETLTPLMLRIVLTGPELDEFASFGFDDHVKMFFPAPGETIPLLPTIGPEGISFPNGTEGLIARDFTPRSYDTKSAELAIDFALNHDGPASRWARAAKVGDKAWIAGPRGSFVIPFSFDWHLLIADSTGLPALARRLEEMPAGTRVVALINIESNAEVMELPTEADAIIKWVLQGPAQETPDAAMMAALAALDLPEGDYFSWIACETALAKSLRAFLITECKANPKLTKASGYWRRGESGVHDHLDD